MGQGWTVSMVPVSMRRKEFFAVKKFSSFVRLNLILLRLGAFMMNSTTLWGKKNVLIPTPKPKACLIAFRHRYYKSVVYYLLHGRPSMEIGSRSQAGRKCFSFLQLDLNEDCQNQMSHFQGIAARGCSFR